MRACSGWASTARRATLGPLAGAIFVSCGSGNGAGSPQDPGMVDAASSGGGTSGGTGSVAATGSSGGSSSSGGSGAFGGSGSGSVGGTGSPGGSGSGATSGATSGASGSGVDSGTSSASGSGSAAGDGGSGANGGSVVFASGRGIVTGVRSVTGSPATKLINLHNGGPSPVQVTNLGIAGTDQALFQVSAAALPATIQPGTDLAVTIRMNTAGAGLPPPPPQDSGSAMLTANLTATLATGSAQARLYGLVLTQAIWEPTLGQILTTLGYKLSVGLAQNNANPNRGKTAQQLPGVEAGTDEVAAQLFVKAGAGSVTLLPVARFSPKGPLPFGWYVSGSSGMRNTVGTMDQVTDSQTSNKARMVEPPLASGSATTFDPGNSVFGIWVYSDELSQKYDTGTASNGDYDYSQDALNSPTNVHRFKAYPLKDASGASIPNNYLLAVEEATNGDYQDYVYVLGNVKASP